jgi:hypothetical protein
MSRMAKGRGEDSRVQLSAASRRKRSGEGRSPNERNARFVRAFADALRDILRHERRRAA